MIDPCCSCRLSKDINQGVVDPRLVIHGTRNLRVIDASVIPVIPDCRIQNSVYMIAEKVRPEERKRGKEKKKRSLTIWIFAIYRERILSKPNILIST